MQMMEEISLCQSSKNVDEKYLTFMKELKISGSQLSAGVLESNLLKL